MEDLEDCGIGELRLRPRWGSASHLAAQDSIEVLRRGSPEALRLLGVVPGEATGENLQSLCRRASGVWLQAAREAEGRWRIGSVKDC